jgi:LPS-assembly lipoprotein
MSRRHAGSLITGLVALLLIVHGCGFHLRTWDMATSIESFYVEAPTSNLLAGPLRRALQQAGVAEAGSASKAEVVVHLLNATRERRSVSVTGQARAAEYEMNLGVQYQVFNGAGTELVPPRWARSVRVYEVDRANVVGSSEEQALLEGEMRSDLIQQIVRTLNAVSGAATGAASGTASGGADAG